MLRCAAAFSSISLGAALVLAQAQVPAPAAPAPEALKFDVASVKVVQPTGRPGGCCPTFGGPGTSDPGRFSVPVDTMMGMLMKAFGVGVGEILGSAVQPRIGGNGYGLYEVTATMPPDTTKAQFQTMFRNLLVERFHLVAHHETRNFPAYELVVDKDGPKLKEGVSLSDDGPAHANPLQNVLMARRGNITLKDGTMEDLVRPLAGALIIVQGIQTQNVNLPRPRVIDKTGLSGKYTFSLDFTPPGFIPGPDDPPNDLPDLFVALRHELGLRLDKIANVPVDVIVVDSVDKVPADN
jgi:uncharacterized protein (TIGR03435 family)